MFRLSSVLLGTITTVGSYAAYSTHRDWYKMVAKRAHAARLALAGGEPVASNVMFKSMLRDVERDKSESFLLRSTHALSVRFGKMNVNPLCVEAGLSLIRWHHKGVIGSIHLPPQFGTPIDYNHDILRWSSDFKDILKYGMQKRDIAKSNKRRLLRYLDSILKEEDSLSYQDNIPSFWSKEIVDRVYRESNGFEDILRTYDPVNPDNAPNQATLSRGTIWKVLAFRKEFQWKQPTEESKLFQMLACLIELDSMIKAHSIHQTSKSYNFDDIGETHAVISMNERRFLGNQMLWLLPRYLDAVNVFYAKNADESLGLSIHRSKIQATIPFLHPIDKFPSISKDKKEQHTEAKLEIKQWATRACIISSKIFSDFKPNHSMWKSIGVLEELPEEDIMNAMGPREIITRCQLIGDVIKTTRDPNAISRLKNARQELMKTVKWGFYNELSQECILGYRHGSVLLIPTTTKVASTQTAEIYDMIMSHRATTTAKTS